MTCTGERAGERESAQDINPSNVLDVGRVVDSPLPASLVLFVSGAQQQQLSLIVLFFKFLGKVSRRVKTQRAHFKINGVIFIFPDFCSLKYYSSL